MSALAEDYECIAFRKRQPISFKPLKDFVPPISAALMKAAGSKTTDAEVKKLNDTFAHYAKYTKGYCGWLVSQAEYWSDLNVVVSERKCGIGK